MSNLQAPALAPFPFPTIPESAPGERAAAQCARFHVRLRAYLDARAEPRRAEVAGDARRPAAATQGWRSPREFDATIDLLDLPASHPRHDEALKAMAKALLGLKDAAGPRFVGGARLLCDRQARDRVAFRPATTVDAFLREALAGTLDQTLRDRHDLPLGFGAVVAHDPTPHGPGTLTHAPTPMPSASTWSAAPGEALQRAFLARLFTNAWWSDGSEQRISPRGDCWLLGADQSFPDPKRLLASLTLMQHRGRSTPLFDCPDDPPASWFMPFAPDLVAGVRAIDTKQLQATLCLKLIALTEQDSPTGTHQEREQAARRLFGAVDQAIAAIESVQALFARNPRITPRQLQLTYPAFLDWLDPRPVPGGRPAPESQRVDKAVQTSAPRPPRADPPQFISDADLSRWLRHYAPFNPFKRKDRTIAPLLRDAIGLRLKKDGPRRQQAAQTLRRSALKAADTLSRSLEELHDPDAQRIARTQARLDTLWHLITDTGNRYGLPPPDLRQESAERSDRRAWSWLPWRRRAQRQA